MRNTTEQNITNLATERYGKVPDPRLREVVTSLVKHLHGFIREVEPTEGEWLRASSSSRPSARCATTSARNSF